MTSLRTTPLTVLARRAQPDEMDRLQPLELRTWDGQSPRLRTEVRLAHDGTHLFVAFRCSYDRLNFDPGLPRDRSVPYLWRFDVVEVFTSDGVEGVPYREVEATPLGQWFAASFDAPRVLGAAPWHPGLQVGASIGERVFDVRLTLPIERMRTGGGDELRVGLYRVHGDEPEREYYSLHPTGSLKPDFHRPQSWVPLQLEP